METANKPSYVVIAYDATKERGKDELKVTVNEIRMRGDILRGGDTLRVLGVLHWITHPCKSLIDCFIITSRLCQNSYLHIYIVIFVCFNYICVLSFDVPFLTYENSGRINVVFPNL